MLSFFRALRALNKSTDFLQTEKQFSGTDKSDCEAAQMCCVSDAQMTAIAKLNDAISCEIRSASAICCSFWVLGDGVPWSFRERNNGNALYRRLVYPEGSFLVSVERAITESASVQNYSTKKLIQSAAGSDYRYSFRIQNPSSLETSISIASFANNPSPLDSKAPNKA